MTTEDHAQIINATLLTDIGLWEAMKPEGRSRTITHLLVYDHPADAVELFAEELEEHSKYLRKISKFLNKHTGIEIVLTDGPVVFRGPPDQIAEMVNEGLAELTYDEYDENISDMDLANPGG